MLRRAFARQAVASWLEENGEMEPLRIALPSGSLLLMRGATQRNWKHEVPKSRVPCGPRINLTFRRVQSRSPGGAGG